MCIKLNISIAKFETLVDKNVIILYILKFNTKNGGQHVYFCLIHVCLKVAEKVPLAIENETAKQISIGGHFGDTL